MKHLFILIPFILGILSQIVVAQDEKLDSDLIRDIVRGHRILEEFAENLSGRIECFRNIADTGSTTSGRQFLFFRDQNLLRLEYIHPMPGTEILPGDKNNDITEVIMRSKDHDFQYTAVKTTGVPYANLFKSISPNETLQLTLQIDFYNNINALVALPGGRVIDLLQKKIGTVESRVFGDVPNALWIIGSETVSKNGNVSNWTVVLNPNQHYALLHHEAYVKSQKTGNTIVASGKITSQKTNDGKIFPKEILLEGQMRERNTAERSIVSISSTNKPDSKLFTEESFKDLGRDYAIVNVLPDQKYVGGQVVNAAPLESRMPDYHLEKNPRIAWPWSRIILLLSGALLVIVACVHIYFQWKCSSPK